MSAESPKPSAGKMVLAVSEAAVELHNRIHALRTAYPDDPMIDAQIASDLLHVLGLEPVFPASAASQQETPSSKQTEDKVLGGIYIRAGDVSRGTPEEPLVFDVPSQVLIPQQTRAAVDSICRDIQNRALFISLGGKSCKITRDAGAAELDILADELNIRSEGNALFLPYYV